MTMVQAAALFGLALATMNPSATDVWGFADEHRVVILTNMQTFPDGGGWPGGGRRQRGVPGHVPVRGFNLVGYTHGAMPTGYGNRHSGRSDGRGVPHDRLD
jgi:hypothetical protein